MCDCSVVNGPRPRVSPTPHRSERVDPLRPDPRPGARVRDGRPALTSRDPFALSPHSTVRSDPQWSLRHGVLSHSLLLHPRASSIDVAGDYRHIWTSEAKGRTFYLGSTPFRFISVTLSTFYFCCSTIRDQIGRVKCLFLRH